MKAFRSCAKCFRNGERAEPAQSNRPFAQKPIARETVSRKESSVVTDAGKAQAADLVGRVADWPVLNAEEKLTAMRDLASRAGACTKCSHLVKGVRRSFLGDRVSGCRNHVCR